MTVSKNLPLSRSVPWETRLDRQTQVAPNGCWLWKGGLTPKGYAHLGVNGKYRPAHRVQYERFKGPIPEGLQIDHLCRVRHCVNPDHLEAVTARENVHRGQAPMVVLHLRNECSHGHSMADAYVYSYGRSCRTCALARKQKQRRN